MKTNYSQYMKDFDFKLQSNQICASLELDCNLMPIPTMYDMDNVLSSNMKNKFRYIQKNVCKMTTFAIGSLINLIVSEMLEEEVFLNIGVWHGYTFFSGLLGNQDKQCFAVDNFSEFIVNDPKEKFYKVFNKIKSNKHFIFEEDCFEYLEKYHQAKLGLYMYDGSHDEESQTKGLVMAEPYFSDDCIILIDDLNQGCPITNSIFTFLAQSKYYYDILFSTMTECNGHPTWWNGLIVLQKGKLKQS